ncbi:hypothetical protein C8R44DRAFT_883491 [Mycena epipterygia]|nr:hypothetical protein C8R44DRAFT_883491 [Mycena epipterygia]
MFANPELYRQRRESYLAQERRMRELRVQDDHLFAADLLAQEIEAEHDHLLAKKLAQEEQQLRELALSVQRSAKAAADQEARARKLEDAARLQRESSERTKQALAAEQLREQEAASAVAAAQAQRRAATTGGRTPSGLSVASSVHKESANNAAPVVSGTTRITHTFRDRVILQRMRLQDLMKAGKSATLDQGISWDKDGNPFEVGPAPSRGSSVGTRGGRVKCSLGAADTKDSRGNQPASTCVQPVDVGNNGVQYPGDLTGKGFADAAAESSNRKDGNSPMPERKANEPPVPPKKDDRSGYYSRPGTAPPLAPAGDPGSEGSSSGEDDDSSDSEAGTDRNYREEVKNSSTSESDSAFEDVHKSKSQKKKRKSKSRGIRRVSTSGVNGGGPPDVPNSSGDDSDSSSADSSQGKGPSRTPRRYTKPRVRINAGESVMHGASTTHMAVGVIAWKASSRTPMRRLGRPRKTLISGRRVCITTIAGTGSPGVICVRRA